MRCVHCLKEKGVTKDHVFPSSWYPENTSPRVQRPTAPACAGCNNKLGLIEEKLFQILAMCISPTHLSARGIHKRLFTALGIGIDHSKLSDREIEIRTNKLFKLLRPVQAYRPGMRAFPGLGLHEGYQPEEHKIIPVPHNELILISEKIVRGLEYSLGNRYVDEPFKLKVYFVEDPDVIAEVQTLLQKYGVVETYGPGFLVQRAEATDGPHPSVLYRIRLWDTLTIYASIMVPLNDEDE